MEKLKRYDIQTLNFKIQDLVQKSQNEQPICVPLGISRICNNVSYHIFQHFLPPFVAIIMVNKLHLSIPSMDYWYKEAIRQLEYLLSFAIPSDNSLEKRKALLKKLKYRCGLDDDYLYSTEKGEGLIASAIDFFTLKDDIFDYDFQQHRLDILREFKSNYRPIIHDLFLRQDFEGAKAFVHSLMEEK